MTSTESAKKKILWIKDKKQTAMPNRTYCNPRCYLVGVETSKFLTTHAALQGDPLSPLALYLTNNSSMAKVLHMAGTQ